MIAPACAWGQGSFTNVTAIVQDPLSNIYQNGTFSVNFVDPGTSGKLPLLPGNQVFQTSYSGSLDSFGYFTVSLPDNGIIASASGATGTSWQFFICANPGILRLTTTNPIPCFSYTAPIICASNAPTTCTSSTITITAQLKAVAAYLPLQNNRYFPVITSSSALPAATGFLQLESGDSICWRNNANSADLCFSKSITDAFSLPNLTVSNLTPGRCVQTSTGGLLTTVGTACGAGVSSVGLALPKEYSISGSPVTTTGTLTGAWVPVSANNFLGGPPAAFLDGLDREIGTASAPNTVNVSLTTTPTFGQAWMMIDVSFTGPFPQANIPEPAGFSLFPSDGLSDAFVTGQGVFPVNVPVTASMSQIFSDNSGVASGVLISIPTNGVPVASNIGASGVGVNSLTVGTAVAAGSTLIADIRSELFDTVGQSISSFSDTNGNVYKLAGGIHAPFNGTYGAMTWIFVCSGAVVNAGGHNVTYSYPNAATASSRFAIYQVTNLKTTPITTAPSFRTFVPYDVPLEGGVSGNLPVTNLNAGLNALSTTFWRGDGVWSALVAANLPATGTNCTGQNFAQGLNAGGTPICTAATTGITNQVFSATTLGSDVAVSATTQTDIMTRTIVMPSSGCPCRVFMSYSLYITTGSSGVGYSAWVNDGSVNMGGTNAGQSNGSSGALTSLAYSGYSTVTYSNSTTVVFTLRTEGSHTYTVRKLSQVAGSAPDSSFQVAAQESN